MAPLHRPARFDVGQPSRHQNAPYSRTSACVYARLANAPANAQAGATPATPANGENAAPSTASELHEPSAQPPMADDICRALEQSAAENALPVEFFGRVIWQESRFDARAVSPPTVLHKEIPGMGRAKRYIITIADDDRAPLDKLCRKLIAADATCDVMRNLHRAGSLRADPAAIAVDRRVTIDGRRSGATSGGAFASVIGRGVAHLTIYLPALLLYFIVLPRFYGFSTLGQPLQLFALAALFALATSFMGQAAGAWFKHPETPTVIFLGISIPQLFLTGFSWPREAIPKSAQAVGYIFPSDFAIDGIVRINQLGASLWEVVRDWRGLWCLAVIYFALAMMSAFLAKRRQAHG